MANRTAPKIRNGDDLNKVFPPVDLVAEATAIFNEPDEPEPPAELVDSETGEIFGPDPQDPDDPASVAFGSVGSAEAPRRGQEVSEETQATAERVFGLPRDEVFVTVRGGGKYLPARRRVTWMRGEPEQHPNWTIETREIVVVPGTLKVLRKTPRGAEVEIEGGYARIEANIYDDTGRLIASGRKTEHSERFLDFVEKAETGAIARALAVAGYGTEAALDLDEGYEADRIADAPVGGSGRPINITSSAIPGMAVGGRTSHVTDAQLSEIARLTRELEIGLNLSSFVEIAIGRPVQFPAGVDASDKKSVQAGLVAFLRSLSFEEGGLIVTALANAHRAAQPPE